MFIFESESERALILRTLIECFWNPHDRRQVVFARAIFVGGTDMRRMVMIAVSAAALALPCGVASAAMGDQNGVRAAAARLDLAQPVARVCREWCRNGFCRQRCFHRSDYDYGERRSYRSYEYDYDRPRAYYERRHYDRSPSVGIYGPGVGVELGGPPY